MCTVIYYEPIKRELNKRLIYVCHCDERLNSKTEGSTCLEYTGFLFIIYYYETIKRQLNKRLLYECRCDERLIIRVRSVYVVYYESIKQEVRTRPINECRCDENLKIKTVVYHESIK